MGVNLKSAIRPRNRRPAALSDRARLPAAMVNDDGDGGGGGGCPARRLDPNDPAGKISPEDQAMRSAENVGRLEKKARSVSVDSQLFAAIRMAGEPTANRQAKDRVRELLQTGADVNASEGPPWWLMAGTLVMPFILCCAFGSPKHYSKTALHVAMIQGDPELVKLLLDSGADPSAAAVFWNCCVCCSWRATASGFQSALMGNPDTGSATAELGDAVPRVQQAGIKQLVMQRA